MYRLRNVLEEVKTNAVLGLCAVLEDVFVVVEEIRHSSRLSLGGGGVLRLSIGGVGGAAGVAGAVAVDEPGGCSNILWPLSATK